MFQEEAKDDDENLDEKLGEFVLEDVSLDSSPSAQDLPMFRQQLKDAYAARFSALKAMLASEQYRYFNERWQTELLTKFHEYFVAAFELYKGDVATPEIKPVHLADIQPWFDSSINSESYQLPTFFPKSSAPAREQLQALPECLIGFSAATSAVINKGASMVSPLHFVANTMARTLPDKVTAYAPSFRSWLHTFIIDFEVIRALLEVNLSKEQSIAPLKEQVQELQEKLSRLESDAAQASKLKEQAVKLVAWKNEALSALKENKEALNKAADEIRRLEAQTGGSYMPVISFGGTSVLKDDGDDKIPEIPHAAAATAVARQSPCPQ